MALLKLTQQHFRQLLLSCIPRVCCRKRCTNTRLAYAGMAGDWLLPCCLLPAGRYVFMQFPFVARAMAPLAPVAYIYNSVPFLP